MMDVPDTVVKQSRNVEVEVEAVPARLLGVRGVSWWDRRRGRRVFVPDEAEMGGEAYQEIAKKVGGEWDEWVFEVDVSVYCCGGVIIIDCESFG